MKKTKIYFLFMLGFILIAAILYKITNNSVYENLCYTKGELVKNVNFCCGGTGKNIYSKDNVKIYECGNYKKKCYSKGKIVKDNCDCCSKRSEYLTSGASKGKYKCS